MTRQFPNMRFELEAREQRARDWVNVALVLGSLVVAALVLAGGSVAFVYLIGGAL